MNNPLETLKTELNDVQKSLKTLRDEIEVRAHLATMDLKQEWEKLQPRIYEMQSYLGAVSDATVTEAKSLQQAAIGLRDRLSALREQNKAARLASEPN